MSAICLVLCVLVCVCVLLETNIMVRIVSHTLWPVHSFIRSISLSHVHTPKNPKYNYFMLQSTQKGTGSHVLSRRRWHSQDTV